MPAPRALKADECALAIGPSMLGRISAANDDHLPCVGERVLPRSRELSTRICQYVSGHDFVIAAIDGTVAFLVLAADYAADMKVERGVIPTHKLGHRWFGVKRETLRVLLAPRPALTALSS